MKKLTTQVGNFNMNLRALATATTTANGFFDHDACATEGNRLFRAAHAGQRLRDGISIVGEQ
jgi:hypothetical protein